MRTSHLIITVVFVAGFIIYLGDPPATAQHAGHTPPPPQKAEHKTGIPAAPKEEAVPAEAPQVEISSEQQQLIGVKTVKVAVTPLRKV
ncbi:MAG: hypothetical protein ACXWMI_08555, partial [Syntrophales bacterium]